LLDFSIYIKAIEVITSIKMLFLIVVGVGSGIIVGALPGLTATMATALLASLTFGWDIYPTLVLIISVWVGAVYGGNKSGILLNIPGTPAALATSFDGYPMAKHGEGAFAMGVATIGSFLGGLIGAIVLAIGAPFIAEIGLKFGPLEYLLLIIWGLTAVGSVSGDSIKKGILTAGLGLAISCIGLDIVYGSGRFTFGFVQLKAGIHFVPALIGAFGFSEVLIQLERRGDNPVAREIGAKSLKNYFEAFAKQISLTLRSAGLGSIIGSIPGIGGEISSIVAYDHARRTVKNPSREFGEGAYEGVLAAETANNSALGGALIPLLTLGIPGDAVTAIILGVLFIHGIRPGPLVFKEEQVFFGIIVLVVVIAHFVMLWLGFAGNRILSQVVKIPASTLMPVVVILSVIGSYAIQTRIFDIYVMLVFGILGYLLKKGNYPIGPLVLGVILGQMADNNLRRSIALYRGELVFKFLTRPIALVLTILIVLTLLSQTRLLSKFIGFCRNKFSKT